MNDFLEELKQESKIINENYRKKKYFFKILNILFFVVILTMILGYAFLYANLKVNFYDKASFIFKILLVIIFFRGVAIIDEDITKIPGKTMLRFFEFIVIISLNPSSMLQNTTKFFLIKNPFFFEWSLLYIKNLILSNSTGITF